MNKKIGLLMVTTASLLLAGCSQQSSSQNKQNAASSSATSSSLLVAKSSVKVSSDNMSPQEAVSLITTYCGLRYGGEWANVAKQAQKDGLQVDLHPTSRYQLSDNGQGVAYDVTTGGKSQGLVYTVNEDDVNIYQNVKESQEAKKLATVSKSTMASYVNQEGQGKLVNDLATKAQVVDKRNGDSTSASSSSSSSSDQKYGRIGDFDVPSEMQGTWYSADYDSNSTVTFSAHTLTDSEDDVSLHLYKQDPKFLYDEDQYMNRSIQNATKNWGRTSFVNVDGERWVKIYGWTQTAGAGETYAVKTENIDGKKVKILVAAGGAGPWVDKIYYQTQDMAQDNAGRKFDDLNYR